MSTNREWLSPNQERESSRRAFQVHIKLGPEETSWTTKYLKLTPEERSEKEEELEKQIREKEIFDYSVVEDFEK